eukprot:7303758-Alexandrium_andersonii.AAC.1
MLVRGVASSALRSWRSRPRIPRMLLLVVRWASFGRQHSEQRRARNTGLGVGAEGPALNLWTRPRAWNCMPPRRGQRLRPRRE